ncbi:MAG TPA: hypothetical protein VIT65_14010 [Microlunatus sp.]
MSVQSTAGGRWSSGASRGLKRVVLAEREAELAALGSYGVEALAGDGRLVFLGGEGGAGKTSVGLE